MTTKGRAARLATERLRIEATMKRPFDDTTRTEARQAAGPSLLIRWGSAGPSFYLNARNLVEERLLAETVRRIKATLLAMRRRERRPRLPLVRATR